MSITNPKWQKEKRRTLRRNMPSAERILWQHINKRQICGHKFRRQFGIGNYIVDFYCHEFKLIIEIDGDSHFSESAKIKDRKRAQLIKDKGYQIVRFTNLEIYHDLENVLRRVENCLKEPPPTPPKRGRAIV